MPASPPPGPVPPLPARGRECRVGGDLRYFPLAGQPFDPIQEANRARPRGLKIEFGEVEPIYRPYQDARLCFFRRPDHENIAHPELAVYNPIDFWGPEGFDEGFEWPGDWGSVYLKLSANYNDEPDSGMVADEKGLRIQPVFSANGLVPITNISGLVTVTAVNAPAPNGSTAGVMVAVDNVTIKINQTTGLLYAVTGGGGTPGDTIPVIVDEAGFQGTTTLFRRNDTRGGLKLRKNTDPSPKAISGLAFASASKGAQIAIAAAATEDAERAAVVLAAPTIEIVPNGGVQVQIADGEYDEATGMLNKIPLEALPVTANRPHGGLAGKIAVGGGLENDNTGVAIKIDPVAGNTVSVSSAGLKGTGAALADNTGIITAETAVVGASSTGKRSDAADGLKLRKNTDMTPKDISGLQFASASKGAQVRIAAAATEDSERAATAQSFATLEVVPNGGVQAKLSASYGATATRVTVVSTGMCVPISSSTGNQATGLTDGLFVPATPAVFVPDP